ncbi:MAG: hypothetical protein QXN63_01510 [Candidatus Bathyarchaeia archaeon]
MPLRKIRVEVRNGGGNRYAITFEGNITKEKAAQLLDLVELLGGPSDVVKQGEKTVSVSKFEQVRLLVEKNFPFTWFSSRDIQACYEREFQQPISLSTVSTYLARMMDRGFLLREGSSNNWKYKLAGQKVLKFIKDE